MKPALSRIAITGLLAASSLLAACGSEGGTEELDCEVRVSPGALALGTLCLGSETELTFGVENAGGAECVVDLALAGMAPQHFALSAARITVPVGTTQPVTVKYHPTAEGGAVPDEDHFARVIVTSNAPTDEVIEVSVDGSTAATETKAILSLACTDAVKRCSDPTRDVTEPCCSVVDQTGNNVPPYYGRSYLTQVEFGQVQSSHAVKVPLQVTNFGCGTLDVSSLTVNPTTGTGFCAASTVTVNTALPASVPGSVSVQTRQSTTVELEFKPTELCSYFASAVVATNDPDIVDSNPMTAMYGKFSIMGAGAEGRVGTTASDLWFRNVATGTTEEMKFSVWNKGNRAADVSAVRLRNGGGGVFAITKVERPLCPAGSGATDIGVNSSFTLAAARTGPEDNNCGEDQADITVAFTPNGAGNFSDFVEIDYGDGVAVVSARGQSNPKVVAFPDGDVWFRGPNLMGCEPLTCNPSCIGLCATNEDCNDGSECLDGVCGSATYSACVETCGMAERTVKLCNEGIAPLKFDDAAQGGGLVVTGIGGGEALLHREPENVDPSRHNTPVFSITRNGCADTAGNGATLQPGECCEATVSYLDSRNGGFFNGELRVYTNDPDYPRDLANGMAIELHSLAMKDYDPEASFVAYDLEMGPGVSPRAGLMAVLDASASRDPACKIEEDVTCNPPRFNPIVSYEWELVDVSGIGEYPAAMEGPIDLDNPDARCPSFINGGNCFDVVDLGGESGKVIHFFPDPEAQRTYKFRLTVKDGVCNPQHAGWTENDIDAR